MQYRSEIDGLRAFAVIPVILFHAGFELFGGGFVGVDVFFVISGYLITTIIVSEMDESRFSLINFYERRARRILPALFFVMIICCPFAWMWLTPDDLDDFSQSLIAVSTFTSNFLFWKESGYFDTSVDLKPLLHTWSLAVEEQYYVLFPLFMMLTWRLGKLQIIVMLSLLAVISLNLAHWGAYTNPTPTFYLLPTRGWEILLGSFVAFFYNRFKQININPSLCQVFSLMGFIFIACSIFIYDKQTPFPSFYALLPTLGTVLVITFTTPNTLVFKVLSGRVLVFIGGISYSAYLWHQPLFAFAKHKTFSEPSSWLMASLVATTFLFAYLTWKYIETPFRRGKALKTKKLVVFSIVLSSVFVTVGIIGHKKDGFEGYFIENRLNDSQRDTYLLIQKNAKLSMVDDGDCKFGKRNISSDLVKRIDKCYLKYGQAVIVLGDSHAINLYNIIAKSKVYTFVVGIAQGGCRPQSNKKKCHYDEFDDFISEYSNKVKVVFFHQSGSYFVEDERGKVDSNLVFKDGEPYNIRTDYIDIVINYVNKLNSKTKTIWLGPFLEARVNLLSLVWSKKSIKPEINVKSFDVFDELELKIADRLDQEENKELGYISLNKWMDISSDFLLVGDCFTYIDVDHFSNCGEDILVKSLREKLYTIDFNRKKS